MSKSESDHAFHTGLMLSFEETLEQDAGVLKAEECGSRAISTPGA